MLTKYHLEESYRIKHFNHTPNLMAQKLPFYLYSCGHFICDDAYYTKRKGLNNYLLIYTISGEGIIKYRDTEVSATQNTCFVINCDEYHYYKTAPNKDWDFYFIHFSGACVNEYFELINGNSLNVAVIHNYKYFEELINEIFLILSSKTEFSDIKLSLNIDKIITAMVENKQNISKELFSNHKMDIERSKAYIEMNYEKDIDVSLLAEHVNISKYYYIKLFKEFVGQTPYDYLIGIRINASKKLLKETELSISEIASSVGFNYVNNYIKAFKNLTGTTPLSFKRHWII